MCQCHFTRKGDNTDRIYNLTIRDMKNMKFLKLLLFMILAMFCTILPLMAVIVDGNFTYWSNFGGASLIIYSYSVEGDDTEVVIPDTFDDKPITGIMGMNKKVTKVTLSSTLETLMENAFKDTQISEIFLPKSLKQVDKLAFNNCRNLKTVIIESGSNIEFSGNPFVRLFGIEAIKDENGKIYGTESIVLYNNIMLAYRGNKMDGDNEEWPRRAVEEEIIIPKEINGEKITTIGAFAFYDNFETKKIIIPDTVTKIGDGAFCSTRSLEEITIPENVIEIGTDLFAYSYKLKTASLPENMASIPKHTFLGCSELESLTLPSNIKSIGEYAFYQCSKLKSIVIPEGVTRIEDYAFADCTSLEEITLPTTLKELGKNTFKGCTALKTIVLPEKDE